MVNDLSTRMMAKPTLRVIRWPFAMTNSRSFASRAIPIFYNVAPGTEVYSLPVSKRTRGGVARRERSTEFSIRQASKKVPMVDLLALR